MVVPNVTLEVEELSGTALYQHAERLERLRQDYTLDGDESYSELEQKYKSILEEIELLVISTGANARLWEKETESHADFITCNVKALMGLLNFFDYRVSIKKQFQKLGPFSNTRYTILEQVVYKTMKSINPKVTYKMISDYVLELIKQDFAKLETEEDSVLYKMAKDKKWE